MSSLKIKKLIRYIWLSNTSDVTPGYHNILLKSYLISLKNQFWKRPFKFFIFKDNKTWNILLTEKKILRKCRLWPWKSDGKRVNQTKSKWWKQKEKEIECSWLNLWKDFSKSSILPNCILKDADTYWRNVSLTWKTSFFLFGTEEPNKKLKKVKF